MIDQRSYTHNLNTCEIKAWKKYQGHGLCDTSAVLYQLSYHANYELYLDHKSLSRKTNFQWSILRKHSEQLHRTSTACSTDSQLLDFFRISK